MSEKLKALLEQKIQTKLPSISIPEIEKLRKCYNHLIDYLNSTQEYSQDDFKEEVEYCFCTHEFGRMQDIADTAETALSSCTFNHSAAVDTLVILRQALDLLEQHMKYSIAAGQATREFINGLAKMNPP